MKASCWTRESREQLENLLGEGYSIQQCAEMLDRAIGTVRTEIKRGCDEEEFSEKRYIKYKATRAELREIFDGYTDDEIRSALKEMQKEARSL